MQLRKYHLVGSALSPAAAEEVSDLLSGPTSTTLYSTLKASLLERMTVSQRFRIQQLLSVKELGDRWLSQLLRHMPQHMSGYTNITDENLLRELSLQHLPGNVHMVQATASTLNLNSLASLADKVLEVATPFVCNVIQQRTLYLIYRNFEEDKYVGGKAACVRGSQSGDAVDGAIPMLIEFGEGEKL
ncbi:hypothetical protein HPB51_007793 [Rhipicephalus microplus]|uniref:DUF7041 domain-containing protein n=1 Tax=Rhipicephalus microplus TaxID=6941 RepID=A0A9J6EZ50_RHIMP|nr:hypothetical protein HPB51_007793 [Rhipicephalus microplus]